MIVSIVLYTLDSVYYVSIIIIIIIFISIFKIDTSCKIWRYILVGWWVEFWQLHHLLPCDMSMISELFKFTILPDIILHQ